jgi:hypothetical protein
MAVVLDLPCGAGNVVHKESGLSLDSKTVDLNLGLGGRFFRAGQNGVRIVSRRAVQELHHCITCSHPGERCMVCVLLEICWPVQNIWQKYEYAF